MAKLCDNVKAMQSNCCLRDDDKDLASLRRRTEDVASKLAEIKSTTKVCHYTTVIHHTYRNHSLLCVLDKSEMTQTSLF